jgi:hypothetical protein
MRKPEINATNWRQYTPAERRRAREQWRSIAIVLMRSRNDPDRVRSLGDIEDLEYAYLPGAELIGLDFQGMNFRGAYLKDALMPGKLQDADLRGAQLQNVGFGACNLQGANLSGANLIGTNFEPSFNLPDITLAKMPRYFKLLRSVDLEDLSEIHVDSDHTGFFELRKFFRDRGQDVFGEFLEFEIRLDMAQVLR